MLKVVHAFYLYIYAHPRAMYIFHVSCLESSCLDSADLFTLWFCLLLASFHKIASHGRWDWEVTRSFGAQNREHATESNTISREAPQVPQRPQQTPWSQCPVNFYFISIVSEVENCAFCLLPGFPKNRAISIFFLNSKLKAK